MSDESRSISATQGESREARLGGGGPDCGEPCQTRTVRPAALPGQSRRMQMASRARRALAGGLALLFLIHAGGLLWIETRRPDLADPEFGLRLKAYQRLATRPNTTQPPLAVVGSSRFACGIDTELLTREVDEGGVGTPAVNLSLAGGTAVWQHLVLRRLESYGPTPDRVLLELFPQSLLGGEQAVFADDYQFPVHRLRHCDLTALGELLPDQSARHHRAWWRHNGLFPLKTHGVALWNGLCPLFRTDDLFLRTTHWQRRLKPTGYGPWGVPHPTAQQQAEAWEVARQQYAGPLHSGVPDPEGVAVYRQTLAWCRSREIQVAALVLMPESPRFRALYSPANWQATGAWAADLGREFGIPVVDAREWLPAEQDFADGHHLLPSAAMTLTLRLANSLGWRPTPEGGSSRRETTPPTGVPLAN